MSIIESLGFDIFATDRASSNLAKVGRSSAETAAKIEAANLKVERSTRQLAAAEEKYGKSSLQAREASSKLTRAQLDLDRSMKTTDDSTKKASTGMKAYHVAAGVAGGVVGAALLKVGKDSVQMASDVGEATSKVNVVFGASGQEVLKFSDTTATSMGISKRAALEAAGTFGNLLVSLKLPQPEAAKMSTNMVQLAADMASFNNASPEEALEAIRSGLVGETEPLRRFGVNMNDATLRTQAMEMGLIRNTKQALTPAVKAQAAYGLMLAQTGTAQGDFARTANGMANQTRVAKARFEDLEAQLGAKLLPAVNGTLSGFLSMADFMRDNATVIKPLVIGVGGLAVAVVAVNTAQKASVATQTAWATVSGISTVATNAQATATKRLAAALKTVGPALAVVGTAAAATWTAEKIGQWSTASVSVKALSKAMNDTAGSAKLSRTEMDLFQRKGLFGFRMESLSTKQALEEFGTAAYNALDKGWDARLGRWQNLGASQARFKKITEQTDAALSDMVKSGNIQAARTKMEQFEKAARDAGVPVASLRKMFPQYAAALEATKKPIDGVTEGLGDQNKKLDQNVAKVQRTTESLIGLRAAENDYEEALDEARTSLETNGKTLDKHTEKGRTNRTALDKVVTATLALRDAAKEDGASIKKQTGIMEAGRQKLIEMGRRFGLTKTQARAYADEVLKIPKKHDTKVNVQDAKARADIARFRAHMNAEMNQINDEKVWVGVGIKKNVGGFGTGLGVLRARGGPVWGAGTETSDSIPARLSHNEHVWTAREVRAAGGHSAVEGLRRSVLGLARGGPALGVGVRMPSERAMTALGGSLNRALSDFADRFSNKLNKAYMSAGFNPSLQGALNFGRTHMVGTPYIWGGVGPRGYDCSGAMSALLNVVQGRNPYQRRFATGSFPSAGFIPGPGSFMIGSRRGNPGHMAGTINGINVESSGSRGFHMGPSARGARDGMFSGVWHLRGYAKGGRVRRAGDPPYDYLSPQGDDFLGEDIRRLFLADRGGIMRSGEGSYNLSGQPERVLSGRQTRQFDRLVQVLDRRPAAPAPAHTGPQLNSAQIGEAVARSLARTGLVVVLDGQTVGRIQGGQADRYSRAG